MRKYKYGLKPNDKGYHAMVVARQNRRKTYEQQLDRWSEVIDKVHELVKKGKTTPEIADYIVRTTNYKIIKRSKEINYDK